MEVSKYGITTDYLISALWRFAIFPDLSSYMGGFPVVVVTQSIICRIKVMANSTHLGYIVPVREREGERERGGLSTGETPEQQ